MVQTIAFLHAHPDDEALLTAGTMAQAAADGYRTLLLVATGGEEGEVSQDFLSGDDLRTRRESETESSAAVLGVSRTIFLGYHDSGLDGDAAAPPGAETFAAAAPDQSAARLAEILRAEDVDLLTSYDRNGGYGHPDHRRVHEVASMAAELAGTPVLLEATFNRDLLKMGLEMAGQAGYEFPDRFEPPDFEKEKWFVPGAEITSMIDVGPFVEHKRASMQAHASQATSDDGDMRTLQVLASLPEELFALAFGTEFFVRPGAPAGTREDSLDQVFEAVDLLA